MRGRHPSGPEFVEKLEGSEQAKQRVQVLLETLAGSCRVGEACERLGISEPRFDQIRIEALQAAVAALEPKPMGRPAHVPSAAEVVAEQLREKIAALEAELKAALIRAELAVTLPRAGEVEAKKAPGSPPRPR
jgi:predicted ArsR family transcriptional regulator